MKLLVFIAPKDFRDETLATLKLFLDKWGIGYSIASYAKGDCIGYHGAVCKQDINANKAAVSDYDGIVLLDGRGLDDLKLYEYRPLLDLLLQFDGSGKYIGAIGNAVRIVARANIIRDKKISAPEDPEIRRQVLLFHGIPTEDKIAISKNVITIKDTAGLEVPLQELLRHFGAM